ncbi:MAG: OB-fold nucleic acid binding domain-containing protein [Nanoarchaeota archaeon]
MDETKIQIITLAWSLIGITILLGLSVFISPEKINIIDANTKIGETVTITGDVIKASYRENVNFITVKDNSANITIVFFEKPNFEVAKGYKIYAKGKIQTYKNELELIAQQIWCINCG